MTPAYAYLRVSGPNQAIGDGYPRQLDAIHTYSTQHSLEIIEIFREKHTGMAESMDRPAWIEMLAAILSSGVKVIVIECLNRLARDLMVQEHIIADLRQRGITLISAAEPDLCSDDPTRVLIRQVMGAVAQYDRSMLVLKLRGARQRMKHSTGRCEGRKPYGHFPAEVPILIEMRRLLSTGMRYSHISAELNRQGHLSRFGTQWWPGVVAKILRALRL